MSEKCKKCGKKLPNNYNGDICGYCKNQEIDNVKKGAGLAFTGLVLVCTIARGIVKAVLHI